MNQSDNSPTTTVEPVAPRARLVERWWFNALWFQLFWLCAVLGRDSLLPVTALLLVLHFALVRSAVAELAALAPVALIGAAVDSTLSLTGVFQFPGPGPIPLWLLALWFAFATTLSRSLDALCRRPLLACLLGAPAAGNYLVGAKLGAVEFGFSTTQTLWLLLPLWMILLPLLCAVSNRLGGTR
ncbi:DUF2878 domain-containing protein [Parahaliea maris]|uniref:DUF2878 domain-containing protein n=1 Tax=Parahaliea maris TaxID=2716870 RepID=A0A5C9A2Q0_9GAMM|nr:DUF2878 domain-containing protein [Parahaliea maris]TXS94050.1 DUF2878 domain-containing protein [Parahaliea maris]